jgi:hypothetical protein
MEPIKERESATQPTPDPDEAGTRLELTAEQKGLVAGWEAAHGRRMTEQEILFGIELWTKTVGEL